MMTEGESGGEEGVRMRTFAKWVNMKLLRNTEHFCVLTCEL